MSICCFKFLPAIFLHSELPPGISLSPLRQTLKEKGDAAITYSCVNICIHMILHARQLCREVKEENWQSYLHEAAGTEWRGKLSQLLKRYATTWPFQHPAAASTYLCVYIQSSGKIFYICNYPRWKRYNFFSLQFTVYY